MSRGASRSRAGRRRGGASSGAARVRGAAPGGPWRWAADGDAGARRRLERRARPADRLGLLPGSAPDPPVHRRPSGAGAAPGPRRRPGRGRRLRRQAHRLPRGRSDPVPGPAARPARSMDRRPSRAHAGGHPGAGAGARGDGGVRRRGAPCGASRSFRPRHRRLHAARARGAAPHGLHAHRALSDPGRRIDVREPVHAPRAGHALPRRGPAASSLRDRARARPHRARDRPRPGGCAPGQPRAAVRHAVGRGAAELPREWERRLGQRRLPGRPSPRARKLALRRIAHGGRAAPVPKAASRESESPATSS